MSKATAWIAVTLPCYLEEITKAAEQLEQDWRKLVEAPDSYGTITVNTGLDAKHRRIITLTKQEL